MTFNQAVNYTEFTTTQLTPNVTVPGSPSEPVTATLTMPNSIEINTSAYGASVSTFSNQVWKIVGTKTDVDLALADTFIISPAIVAVFSITIDIRDSADSQIEDGSYDMTGVELGSPLVITSNADVEIGNTDGAVTTHSLNLQYTTASATNKAVVTIGATGVGTFLDGRYGDAEVVLSNGDQTATLYGLRVEVQAFVADINYVRPETVPIEFTVDVELTGPSQTTNSEIRILLDEELMIVSNLNQAHSYTEDVTFQLDDIVITDINIFDTYTATLTLSDIAAGALTTGTFGATTSTYTGGTGVWEAIGILDDVNAALASVAYAPAQDYNSAFTITTDVDDAVTSPQTGSIVMTGIPVDDAPEATNMSVTHTWTENVTYPMNTSSLNIVVTDIDSSTVTATLTMDTGDDSLGTLSSSGGGAFNAGTGVWEITDTLANVNTALEALEFDPTADLFDDFTIATHVESSPSAFINGTLTMDGVSSNVPVQATNMDATHDWIDNVVYAFNTDSKHIVVTDPDGGDVITATLTLDTNDDSIGTLSSTGGGSFTAGTGVWTISDTVTTVNTALEALIFTPELDAGQTFTIDTHVDDNETSVDDTLTMQAVLQASNMDQTHDWVEIDVYQFNFLSKHIVVSNTQDTITATLTIDSNDDSIGALTSTGGGSFTPGTGVWTITDTKANVNTALEALIFTPNPFNAQDFTIDTHVDDGTLNIDGTLTMDVELVFVQELLATGQGDFGVLGNNSSNRVTVLTQIGIQEWIDFDVGEETAIAIKSDRTLWTWGRILEGNLSSPTQVGALTDWVKCANTDRTFAALKTDGTLWTWGEAQTGALGHGGPTTVDTSSPVQVGSDTDWNFISMNGTGLSGKVFATKNDGTLWAWGSGGQGALGLGDSISRSSPTQVAGGNWLKLDLEYTNSIALKTDGTIWSTGSAIYGGLGQNNLVNRSVFLQIGSLKNWSDVATGQYSSAAVKTDGTLWSWGDAGFGQLGIGSLTTDYSSPIQVFSDTDWASVAMGRRHMVAIKLDGTLWSTGNNGEGQLGQGGFDDTIVSISQIGSDTDWFRIACSEENTFATKTSNELLLVSNMGITINWDEDQVYPFNTNSAHIVVSNRLPGDTITATLTLSTDDDSIGALSSTGGGSFTAGTGVWTITNTLTNVNIALEALIFTPVEFAGEDFTIDTHVDDGTTNLDDTITMTLIPLLTLYTVGEADLGVLGNETVTPDTNVFEQIGGVKEWRSLSRATGNTADGVKKDGTLWTWGDGTDGAGGHGDTIDHSSPHQVGSLTDWLSASAGPRMHIAVKDDGTLWSWGDSANGQLGLGDNVDRSSPVQVGSDTWRLVRTTKVATSFRTTFGINTSGELWSAGGAGFGQLGNGVFDSDQDTMSRCVGAGATSNWAKVDPAGRFTMALRTDGTIWSTGRANSGQHGNGTVTPNINQFEQIGGLSSWVDIASGNSHAMAIRDNGGLWAWGVNSQGQLGLSNTTNLSSPVQIGSDLDWAIVNAGTNFSLAVKTDGTLWTWGENTDGQLALGDNTSRSSPVQVGSSTDWAAIIGAGAGTAAGQR